MHSQSVDGGTTPKGRPKNGVNFIFHNQGTMHHMQSQLHTNVHKRTPFPVYLTSLGRLKGDKNEGVYS